MFFNNIFALCLEKPDFDLSEYELAAIDLPTEIELDDLQASFVVNLCSVLSLLTFRV